MSVGSAESCPVVSVIVPVYNVKEYLDRCLESIKQQTFCDFEALLVDDGSTDGSDLICRMFEDGDSRFRYFHKLNGGLSDARNYGVNHSVGRFITFVDSDDWVEPTYIEEMLTALNRLGTDVATCIYNVCRNEDRRPWKSFGAEEGFRFYSCEEALSSLLYDERINVSATGKLFSRSLFDGFEFPVGKKFEDVGSTYRLIAKSSSVAVSGRVLYNYAMRDDSITHVVDDGIFDRYELAKNAYEDLSASLNPVVSCAARRYMVVHGLSVLRFANHADPLHRKKSEGIRRELKEHGKEFLSDDRVSVRDRSAFVLSAFGLRVLQFAWAVYSKVVGR